MPLTLSDIPEIMDASQDLIRVILSVLDPKSPGGKRVTKAELLIVLEATGSFVIALARALAD